MFRQQSPEAAALSKYLEILQWLHKRGCPLGSDIAQKAIPHGDMPMLKWIQAIGCPLDSRCMQEAASCGDLAILEWLYHEGCLLSAELYYQGSQPGPRPYSEISAQDGGTFA